MAHPLESYRWFGTLLVADKAEKPIYILLNAIIPTQASLPVDSASPISSHEGPRPGKLTLAGTFRNWNAGNSKLMPVLINFKRPARVL